MESNHDRPRAPRLTSEVEAWLKALPIDSASRVTAAINRVQRAGPTMGRPLVDRVRGSRHHNMKELRVGSMRVLFVFDRDRTPVMLLGGDKRGAWNAWYPQSIRKADMLYAQYRRDNGREGPSHGQGSPGRGR
ncbi:MAG: type II toxin-antitoxin system RelE/ParE family toxin [Solirubrobacteraceae bacterium]